MKKIILIMTATMMLSCEKENIQQESCNCGLVVSDNVQDYSVVIRNNCSGNEKKFKLQQGDWMKAYVGSDFCITNITSW